MEDYIVTSKVKIRREPKIVEYMDAGKLVTNQVGLLDVGTRRVVYETVTDEKNNTWGRISQPDAAGISQWACIKGLNRTYMKLVNVPDQETGISVRLQKLEDWARKQGYTP